MEISRFRVTPLDPWKTCAPLPLPARPPDNIFFVQLAQARPFFGLWSLYFPSKITDVICFCHLPVPQSYKISKSFATLVKPQLDTSISTFGTSTNNTGVTWSRPFSPSFLPAPTFVLLSFPVFIPIIPMPTNTLPTTLRHTPL